MSELEKIVKDYTPFLEEIWKALYRSAIAFTLFFCVGFYFAGAIIQKLISFFHLEGVSIVIISPFQFLDLSVDMGLMVAFFCAAPIFIWQLYSFLRPALSKSEFRAMLLVLPASFVLFIIGFVYGFASLYWGLGMIADVNSSLGLKNMWDAGLFISELTLTATLLGFLFQFPLVMGAMINSGILSRKYLASKRREAYAIIIIIVALLPPTDGISLLIMSVPLVFLYELSVFFSRSG